MCSLPLPFQLNRLSSPPHYKSRNYFVVDYYGQLYEIVNQIYPRLCSIGTSPLEERPAPSSEEEEEEEEVDDSREGISVCVCVYVCMCMDIHLQYIL